MLIAWLIFKTPTIKHFRMFSPRIPRLTNIHLKAMEADLRLKSDQLTLTTKSHIIEKEVKYMHQPLKRTSTHCNHLQKCTTSLVGATVP